MVVRTFREHTPEFEADVRRAKREIGEALDKLRRENRPYERSAHEESRSTYDTPPDLVRLAAARLERNRGGQGRVYDRPLDPVKMVAIGQRLREMREARRLTRREFANRSQVTIGHIAGLELGQVSASLECVARLADGLDMSLFDFLLGLGYIQPEDTNHEAIVHPVLLDLLAAMPVSEQLKLARDLRMGKRKRVRVKID